MAETITPIAYLLKVLHIPYTQLAQLVGVDRSVVNKWALGTRSFRFGSKHYDTVVDYLVQANKEDGNERLEEFFREAYPMEIQGPDYLRNCVHRFLSLPSSPVKIQSVLTLDADVMKHYRIPVSNTVSGRFAMLMQLLGEMLYQQTLQELVIFDDTQFTWITENKRYCSSFTRKLLDILEKGHSITLLSDAAAMKAAPGFKNLIPLLYPYSNFAEYICTDGESLGLSGGAYYAIRGKRVIYSKMTSRGNYCSLAFGDELSLLAFEQNFCAQKSLCVPNRLLQSIEEVLELFDHIVARFREEARIYVFEPTLTWLTMSPRLLEDVLEENGLTGEKKDVTLRIHQAVHTVAKQKRGLGLTRELCYYGSLQEAVKQASTRSMALGAIFGQEVVINERQLRWHIEDTIALLEGDADYQLALIRFPMSKEEKGFSFLCQDDHFCAACAHIFKELSVPQVAQYTMQTLDQEWERIPVDYKGCLAVAEKLRALLGYENSIDQAFDCKEAVK